MLPKALFEFTIALSIKEKQQQHEITILIE